MIKLKEIYSLLFIDIGAPTPTIVANEQKLNLIYYYEKKDGNAETYSNLPQERDVKSDIGIAILSFSKYCIYKTGYPNDEVLSSHPYYSLGLTSYGMFEVDNSDWISAIKNMNTVHPFHNATRFNKLKHFVITFKDSTFECLAESAEVNFTKLTLSDALKYVCSTVL